MKHCKTCRHWVQAYPLNKQLGNCLFLMVSSNQPCGHTITGNYIDTKVFTPKSSENPPVCVNRTMDDFGCVYHVEAMNMYDVAVKNRAKLLQSTAEGFNTTPLSEFAAGYASALENVKEHGLERVLNNATSGIPK